jgi:hypothetical protein
VQYDETEVSALGNNVNGDAIHSIKRHGFEGRKMKSEFHVALIPSRGNAQQKPVQGDLSAPTARRGSF